MRSPLSLEISLTLVATLIVGCSTAERASQQKLAPLLNEGARDAIPGQYIVVFSKDVVSANKAGAVPGASKEPSRNAAAAEQSRAAQDLVRKLDGKVEFTYNSALIGFSAKLSPAAVKALRAAPGVIWIEQDLKGTLDTIEINPPTGLDRTSERLLPLDNRYTYSETGSGVHAYVIDTGIRATHTDFGGRVTGGVDEVMDGHGTDDCYHHGTHVAGIIGSTTYGIAKQVNLHPVRVGDCAAALTSSRIIAGVDWVTANAVHPAVINMSLHTALSPSLDTAVTNAISAGIVVVAATGNATLDACTISPAHLADVIAVGSIDPTTDARAISSGIGTCVDLFAPGVNILSTWNTSDTATQLDSGTSMATPHVAGVAARYLQNHPAATPADVWTAIHAADDVAATPGWAGVVGPGVGSPNELLHWGSLNDGFNDGDPHLTTVDGTHYNFQSAGEFVYLRSPDGMQIQTRQTPIATTFDPGPDPYDGLATCVSLNSAVAARVGSHRVSYEPNISGVPDPKGMQLRVDGVLKTLSAQGLNLGSGGRVVQASAGNGIEIDFPNGTVLIATPAWWASQSKWYLNVDVYRTPATEGIMGALAPGSWLPAMPNGASLGPMPGALHQRYVVLNQQFADAWRVSNASSLFDYAPRTSTATFTNKSWPLENPPCALPDVTPVKPIDAGIAKEVCRAVDGKQMNADCVFDVTITGETGFAKTYLIGQRLRVGATTTTVKDALGGEPNRRAVTFTATVTKTASGGRDRPTGTVQFTVNDEKVGEPVKLDANGQASWTTPDLTVLDHDVVAKYMPSKDGTFLPSSGLYEKHVASIE